MDPTSHLIPRQYEPYTITGLAHDSRPLRPSELFSGAEVRGAAEHPLHVRAGEIDHAGLRLHEALSLMRDFGSPYYQAEILAQPGDLVERQGDTESAVDSYGAAAELYAEVGDPKADVMRARVAALTDQ